MVWVRPSAGIFFGVAAAQKDDDDQNQSGSGGLVLGNLAVQIGALLGGVVGWGNKWGFYTGLSGALALLPFLGFGFIGIPLGIHYKKKFGLGLIIPVFMTEWYIGLIAGIAAFFIAKELAKIYH